jgi:TonB family protein
MIRIALVAVILTVAGFVASAAGARACTTRNRPASVIKLVQPDYPESARDVGIGAVAVEVQVSIGSSGNLIGAEVYKSSSNMAIDQAALQAARRSIYQPRLKDCQPTTADLLLHFDISPGP